MGGDVCAIIVQRRVLRFFWCASFRAFVVRVLYVTRYHIIRVSGYSHQLFHLNSVPDELKFCIIFVSCVCNVERFDAC